LKRYASNLETQKSAKEKAADRQKKSFQLNLHLSTLFSPKQKELVFKKYNKEPLTKTEHEYYPRVVKKKIMALTNGELKRIATALAKKTGVTVKIKPDKRISCNDDHCTDRKNYQ